MAHYNLGTTLQTLGRPAEAITHYQKAVQIRPEFTAAYSNLGTALRTLGRLDEAISAYLQAISLEPGFAVAHNNLAAMYERTNQLDRAEQCNQRALSIAPNNPDSRFIRALLQRRRGDREAALAGFNALEGQALSENYAQRRWFELGKLLDSKGDYQAAIEAFTAGNHRQAHSAEAGKVDGEQYRSRIAGISAALRPELISSHAAANEDSSPIFIVGFPRSGTTLLDQILDAHPGLQVMEEKRIFAPVEAALQEMAGPYPQAVSQLAEADIHALRSLYFKTVDRHFTRQPMQQLVDKFPLNIEYLPLIHCLFPDAHIILAARHPCDVVLSNFMQYYQLNDSMANFFTIEDTVQLYHQVMELYLRCVETFPLKTHRIQYEALVSDFDTTARQLFEFLEVDWNDAVVDFHLHAGKKSIINTPSYEQVTQPIYSSASGRWLQYRQPLAPYLDRLDPYIEKLGYSQAQPTAGLC